ncbi:MAG TPA: F0F1 ATP synthase subunit B [Spirochaetia bacterium]|nr:F0F1 ATP synthase subunit B [Spirochaetia bacterium]
MNINATLIVEMITFLLFVWFVMGVIWPPVIRALEKRRTQIAEGIAAADQGRQALDVATKEGEKLVAEARNRAAEILRAAEDRAQMVIDEAVTQGKREADAIIAAAHQEMDVQLKAAKRELYTEIAGLALKAAGQVVHEELDDDKHHKLVGKLVQSWS